MAAELEPIQLEYFNGLRNHIIEPPVIQVLRESLKDHQNFKDDIKAFKNFLEIKGLTHDDSSCFELIIPKAQMLALFEKMQADKCLAITNCFGFDELGGPEELGGSNVPIKTNKFQIMQKGIIVFDRPETDTLSDDDLSEIYNSKFRDAKGLRQIFKDFDLGHRISECELKADRDRLNIFYTDDQFDKTYHGYALPVDVMIQILTDTDKLGNSESLKVTFGLTGFNVPNIEETLGNFTFYISDVDTGNANYFVKCRSKLIDGSAGDCPPKTGCV